MITNSKLQVLPATSDNANLFLSLQPNSAGLTNTILSATALTYNPFSRTLSLNGIRWPAADGTAGQVLRTDGAGNLTFGNAGLQNFTDALSITAPNATVPVASLTATNSGYANIDYVIAAKGTGAILAQIPDGTLAGGNKRGTNAVDFQMSRQVGSQVAGAPYSVIVGGVSNSINPGQERAFIGAGTSNTITGGGSGFNDAVIAGGKENTITYSFASGIVAGQSNSISATYNQQSFIGAGNSNTVNGELSSIVGGLSNSTNGIISFIGGGNLNVVNSAYGVIGGGFTNTNPATATILVTIWSVSTKANCALGANNANITVGMIVRPRTGQSSINSNIVSITNYLPAGSTFATTSGSGNGTTYTLNHANGTYAVDSWITIAGVTLTSGSIIGTWLVTGSGTGFVTFANTSTGTISVQGTINQSTQIVVSPSATSTVTGGQLTLWKPAITIVGGANNIASGSYSFIGGGGDITTATNRNTASGDWSAVIGGYKNTASGSYSSIINGTLNTASNYSAFIGSGDNNLISGTYSAVITGTNNLVNSSFSTVVNGYNGNTRSISGYTLLGTGASPFGISSQGNGFIQAGLLVLGKITSDATPTVLVATNSIASATNQIALPSNSAYYVKGSVIATVTGGGATKAWTFEVVIKKALTNATTAIVGTSIINITAADTGAATWIIALTADTTNGALAITVTGQVANTIRWVCRAETTEATF